MSKLASGTNAGELAPSQNCLLLRYTRRTRRSAMHQSSTLYVGMDGHKASITVAYVAKDHDAAVLSLAYAGLA